MLTFPPSHLYNFTSQDWYMYPPFPTNFNVLFTKIQLQKSHPHFFPAFWSCQPNEHTLVSVSEHTPPSFRWAPKLRSSIRDAPWRQRCPCSGRPSPTPRPAEKKLVVLGANVPYKKSFKGIPGIPWISLTFAISPKTCKAQTETSKQLLRFWPSRPRKKNTVSQHLRPRHRRFLDVHDMWELKLSPRNDLAF